MLIAVEVTNCIKGTTMKIFAYFLMVLFALTDIPLVGILSLILWGFAHWQIHKERPPGETLFRSKVAAILGSLILAALGASLVAIFFSNFPEISCSYEGIISFFLFWFVGIVIVLRSKRFQRVSANN